MERLGDYFNPGQITYNAGLTWKVMQPQPDESCHVAGGLPNEDTAVDNGPTVRFFDAGPEGDIVPDDKGTIFTNGFVQPRTTRIGYQLELPNPLYGLSNGTVQMSIVVRGPHGLPVGRQQYPITVTETQTRIRICNGMGLGQPGYWAVGSYIFSVYLGTTPMARGKFTIV